MLIADDLRGKGDDLRAAVDDGACVLAVCGGYQLLGHRYRGHQGDEMRGICLVDLETVAGDTRMIGNVVLRCELRAGEAGTMVGFENHAGRTTLGPGVKPLGRVIRGGGNNGEDGGEGVHAGAMHRHLRPRAAAAEEPVAGRLADRRGLARTAASGELEPLDDELELAAHRAADRDSPS